MTTLWPLSTLCKRVLALIKGGIMSRKSILLILIVLSLGFTLIACTTGRSQRYPRYPNYPPYPGGQGYPGYPPAPNRGLEQVEVLADHLKDATAEVAEEAKDTMQEHPDFENSAMPILEDLEKEANEFHQKIGDGGQRYESAPPYGDPGYGGYSGSGDARREQFTEVLQKYYAARKTLNELPEENEVQKDFERVTSIMRNLT
jgi:hypothetical protein